MPFCRATTTAGGWSRPGTQWVCGRPEATTRYWKAPLSRTKYIARILPPGGADNFIVAMFAWALLGFGNIYYGVAQRAIDLALPGTKKKTSIAVSRSMTYHPESQHMVAEMALAVDPIGPHLDRIAEDWSNGVDHGATWPAKIVSAKYHTVEAGWRIVDKAMEVSGGAGAFSGQRIRAAVSRRAAAAFIRRTLSSCTKSSPRRRLASISASNRAGVDPA
jgi:hypothetical protein